MQLAIYDLDRTITRRGTFTPFLMFAALHNAPWRLLLAPGWIVSMLGYVFGFYDRRRLKEIGFGLLVGRRIAPARLRALSRDYARAVIRRNVWPEALALIAADKKRGATLLMATASPDYYADELGAELGFDAVIATRQQRDGAGDYLSAIASENCYGTAKLAMIEDWLAERGLDRSQIAVRFYTDHHSDAPTLDWADEAVIVNGKEKALRLARERQWDVRSFA